MTTFRSCLLGALATALLSTATEAQTARPSYVTLASDSSALLAPVTISAVREPLRAVVQLIASRANASIAFDDSLPGLNVRTTLRVTGMPARQALGKALDGTPLEALVSPGGQVVLRRRPATGRPLPRVAGVIIDSASGVPLAGAHVQLIGTRFGAVSRDSGRFTLGEVPDGTYSMRVTRLGFEPFVRPRLRLPDDSAAGTLTVRLRQSTIALAELVVTPGYFGLLQGGMASPLSMSRDQIETIPQIGEDIYRAVSRLPGVSGDDFSAKFNVRGGSGDELFVTLDGLELVEPFHLRDLGGAFSIVDMQALGSAELTTGGFSAERGDRLTGLFTMRSLEPRTDRTRLSTGISIMNARATAQGGFAQGKGGWLLSARPGYIDLALKFTDLDPAYRPRYYDVFGKMQYALPNGGRIAVHFLNAVDNLTFNRINQQGINSHYGSSYAWLAWDGTIGRRMRFESIASAGLLRWQREGDWNTTTAPVVSVSDVRRLTTFTVRQDWSYEPSRRLLTKWGASVKRDDAQYDYSGRIRPLDHFVIGQLRAVSDSSDIDLSVLGMKYGAYIAERVKPVDPLTVELGARYDHSSLVDESVVSPRLNVAWNVRDRTTLRLAWGRYAQSQAAFGLQVQDGQTQFAPAERAEQRIVGVDQEVRGLLARVEAYDRRTTHRRPEFVGLGGDIWLLPEVMFDRRLVAPSESRSRGLELMLSRSGGQRIEWSASYSLASSRDLIAARWIPRGVDQRHTAHFDWSIRPSSNHWRFSASGVWHSGTPYTPTLIRIDTLVNTATQFVILPQWVAGALNAERLPAYHRLDMRWTRYFDTKSGRVSLFGELYNAFNASNTKGYYKDVDVRNRTVFITSGPNTQFPRLPVAGFAWEF